MARSRSRARSTTRRRNTPSSKESQSNSIVKYEFGGPLGAFGIIFGLPLVIYLLYFTCNADFCLTFARIWDLKCMRFVSEINVYLEVNRLFSLEALSMYLLWMSLQFILALCLPGEIADGVPIPGLNGKKLKYPLSGHLQFWTSILLMGHSIPQFGFNSENNTYHLQGLDRLPLEYIYDHYIGLITWSVLGAFLLSIYLYLSSFTNTNVTNSSSTSTKVLASGGNTGNMLYDFFIGRELNPRIGSLDLKYICELRPGLIGWCIINLGMASKQYMNHLENYNNDNNNNTFGISMSMLLIVLLQGLYVWDALFQERAILTTMDITTDGFGYMLAFGDLAWVPFIYSLQARYLVDYDPQLSISTISFIFVLHAFGYFVFRCANSEKDKFRRDPSSDGVQHLTYMQTKRGTKLITSGWWGMARKINYTGDWLITFSWCLLCGFDSPIPYFQAIYFAVLLIHRAKRDDEMCQEKYGDDWVEYKKRVPYLFIPYVY